MNNLKYGIRSKVCGVYLITNKITGDSYVGSSVDIAQRCSNHFNRDARKYPNKPFYRDTLHYGYENFEFIVLEECERSILIERELYYYHKLHPTYNVVTPSENNFKNPEVRKLAIEGTKRTHNLKEKYDCDEYRTLFRSMHVKRMKPIEMLKDGVVIKEFISIREGARWCDENTEFKGKNKTSKIKSVCDGERKSAFGYSWRYKKV